MLFLLWSKIVTYLNASAAIRLTDLLFTTPSGRTSMGIRIPEYALRGIMLLNSWIRSMRDYYRFVDRRKVTKAHGVIPDAKLFAAVLLTIAVAISFAYLVLDPRFDDFYYGETGILNRWFTLTTDIGKSHWLIIGTGSIVLFMSAYRDDRLSVPHMVQWHHVFLHFYFALTTIVFSGLIAIVLKNLIGRARPALFDGSSYWMSVPFGDSYTFASFPSGHSTTIGALAAIIYLLLPRFRVAVFALALWVGASRVGVGAHYPSDVIAGLAVGILFTWLYARAFARKRLLFEFSETGSLRLRNLASKRARRKARRRAMASGKPAYAALFANRFSSRA